VGGDGTAGNSSLGGISGSDSQLVSAVSSLPVPLVAGAAGGAIALVLLSLSCWFCCVYSRSLRRRRDAQRVSLVKVTAADWLVSLQVAGGEDSTAYQLDALTAVFSSSAVSVKGGSAGASGARRQQLAEGALQDLLDCPEPAKDAQALSPAPTPAAAASRDARVALLRQVTTRLPRQAFEAAVLASIEAAGSALQNQESMLRALQKSAPPQSEDDTSTATPNPLAEPPDGDSALRNADDTTLTSSSAMQRALINSAVAALCAPMPPRLSASGSRASYARQRYEPAAVAGGKAASLLRPELMAALADAGAASTVFLRAYHRTAAAADARLPDGACVPLSALLPAAADTPPGQVQTPSRRQSEKPGAEERATFGVSRSLCLGRLQDRMAAASQSAAGASGAAPAARSGSLVSTGVGVTEQDEFELGLVAVEEGGEDELDGATELARESPCALKPDATGLSSLRSSTGKVAAVFRSSVQAVALGTLSHKRSAGLGAMRASAGELKTAAALTEAQLARRTVEALVVLALDACAKRAATLVVSEAVEGAPRNLADAHSMAVHLAAARGELQETSSAASAAKRAVPLPARVGSVGRQPQASRGRAAMSTLLPAMQRQLSRARSGLQTPISRRSLVFSQASPLRSLTVSGSDAADAASLAERLLTGELAVLSRALQSADAAARQLACDAAVATVLCRKPQARIKAVAAGKGVAKTLSRPSATARGSLALIESPLLQRMRQRRVSTMTTAAQGRSPHMSGGFLKATPHSSLRATLSVPTLPALRRPALTDLDGSTGDGRQAPSSVAAEPPLLQSSGLRGAASKARVVTAAERVVSADEDASPEASVSRSRSRVRPSMVGSAGAVAGTSTIRSLTSSRQSVASGGRAAYSPYRRGGVASGTASQKRV
jgi:hypothetical protein